MNDSLRAWPIPARGSASKALTSVWLERSLDKPDLVIRVMKAMEGHIISSASYGGVLYTLANLVGEHQPALITVCIGTGTRHRIFRPPHIPPKAARVRETAYGVIIIDRQEVAWSCD